MANSIKNFLLESEMEKDENFVYFDGDVISKIKNIIFNSKEDYILIDFFTTYGKEFKFVSKLSDFIKWLNSYFKSQDEKSSNVFLKYLTNFFSTSKESEEELNEIIDDTNEIMPDDDLSNNSSNTMIGTTHKMDLEKIFKRSMPKSVRNYSGNLGLGTVVW